MKKPKHVGFIPDGNRRWATSHDLNKEEGYQFGIEPGLKLLKLCREANISEVTIYGFTQENTRRASAQKHAFTDACVRFANDAIVQGAALKVFGDAGSAQFPEGLKPYLKRQKGKMKVNLLVNYGWQWDLDGLKTGRMHSHDIPRMDLIVRWGGGCRLSGFLPAQSVYADMYVVKEYWPDFKPEHLSKALEWFSKQDRTLGG